jgi:hypothetical protein
MKRLAVAVLSSAVGLVTGCGSGGAKPPPALGITTSSLPAGRVDAAYSATLAATGGTAPYSWSVASGNLPTLLSLDGATGTISGRPSEAGTSSFTARVADAASGSATKALSIAVLPAAGTGPLEGDPSAPAVSALRLLDEIDGVSEAEMGLDTLGRRVARTKLLVQFSPGATVGEVNALLAPLGARIIAMIPPVPHLLIRIADPGSVAALDIIVASLEASPAIEIVLRGLMPEPASLPPGVDPRTLDGFDAIDHLLGVKVAAAWNARKALDRVLPPVVVVADHFGDGPPAVPPFDVGFLPGDYSRLTYEAGSSPGHGYHVLGIIGADYANQDGSRVTGLYSGAAWPIEVRAIDIRRDPPAAPVGDLLRELSDLEVEMLILLTIGPLESRQVVVNTSLGWSGLTPAEAADWALAWIKAVRAMDLEHRIVHATSAGNVKVPGEVRADLNGGWSAAALLPLADAAGDPVPNLANTIVVENLVQAGEPPYKAKCLWKGTPEYGEWLNGSKRGGNLAAVGTDVLSYLRPWGSPAVKSGTSMATPQVAALAAYLWALAPSLSAQEVRDRILSTARNVTIPDPPPDDWPERCQTVEPAKVIDAYGALLRADRPEALLTGSPADAPVRFAILDVAGSAGTGGPDGVFDEGDLRRFLQGFREGPPGAIPDASGCGGYDWSRFDLNGDGKTGGCYRDRLDLDMDGLFATAPQLQGPQVLYAELDLRDQDVLCYYAYSPLFAGSPAGREALLAGLCGVQVEEVTRWETPQLTGPQYRPLWGPYAEALAVAGSGDAFTLWAEPTAGTMSTCWNGVEYVDYQDSTSYALRAKVSRLGEPPEAFTVATDTLPNDPDVELAVAADAAGNAIAAWVVFATGGNPCTGASLPRLGLWVSRYTREGWSPAIELWALEVEEVWWATPRAGIDRAGNVTLVWKVLRSWRDRRFAALAARYTVEGGWGPVEELGETYDLGGFGYTASASGQGMALLADGSNLWARRHDSAGWLPAELIYPGWVWGELPLFSVNARGDAVVGAGDWLLRLDARAGWRLESAPALPEFGSAGTERLGLVVLDDAGGIAYLGTYDEASAGDDSHRRVAWVTRHDDVAGTWSEPAVFADYAEGLAPSGFGARAEGPPYYCRDVGGTVGLVADASGNLTAWAQDVTFLRRQASSESEESVARVLVVARRYHAASATWGPIETVYSTDEGSHDYSFHNHSTSAYRGKKTGVIAAGGSCSPPVLMGVVVEWEDDGLPNPYWWCENSLHLARAGLTSH